MAFFDDMAAALQAYPETYVMLEIVDVSFPDDVLNVNEEATFKVLVYNNGPLQLTGVRVRIKAKHGATLKRPGFIAARLARDLLPQPPREFVDEQVSDAMPPIAGYLGLETTQTFTLKAPAGAQASTTLIEVTLYAWDASPDHILLNLSVQQRNPTGTYSAEVVAA